MPQEKNTTLRFELTKEEESEILKLARTALEMHVREGKTPGYKTSNPKFETECGAFVTLHKDGELRGCIGYVEAFKPLYMTIIEMAQAASTKDPRFSPVSPGELADIHLEVSVLSPLAPIRDFSLIEIGRHGLVVRQGFYSGLLLPQVATEWKMDVTTFLEHTCMKAGLHKNAYKEGADVYYFSAQVFSEERQ